MKSETIKQRRIIFFLLVMLAFTSAKAWSKQEQQEESTEKATLLLGAGMVVQDEPLKGLDSKVFPIPFYMYQGRAFSMRGLSARYDVLGEDVWTIGALAKVRTDGYDPDDSSFLNGMSDRKNSLDVGAELSVRSPWGGISLNFVTDALGVHDGQEAQLLYMIPFRAAFGIEKLGLRPMFGINWRSENLNDYYYGVRTKEAAVNRPKYESGDSVNPFAGIALDYQLDERWSIFTLFNNEWLSNEITDSPIVDQDNKISIVLGLVYRF